MKWYAYELWLNRLPRDDTPEPAVALIDADVIARAQRGEFLVTRARQADHAIKYIGDQVLKEGPLVSISLQPKWFAALVGAPNMTSLYSLMDELRAARLVSWSVPPQQVPIANADLTLDGWERYEAMTHRSHDGGYGFFAWEFASPETGRVFNEVLKPAFEKLRCPVKDMHDLRQPGLIDNTMQDRIRNASFVIVDLTDGNHGAYWEGGFAQALGKPVVYVMEQEAFDDPGPHFDTNHYTFVLWGGDKEDADFVEELVDTLRQHPQISL